MNRQCSFCLSRLWRSPWPARVAFCRCSAVWERLLLQVLITNLKKPRSLLPPIPCRLLGAELRLNLQLQDTPVRDLIQLLAHQKGISVLVSEEVSGTLSMNLVDAGLV
jgi:hypothetical protein